MVSKYVNVIFCQIVVLIRFFTPQSSGDPHHPTSQPHVQLIGAPAWILASPTIEEITIEIMRNILLRLIIRK